MRKVVQKYRAPFRVYITDGWREYADPLVVDTVDAVALKGRGLYNLSEDSWYAEDANGKQVDVKDIPRVGGYYESTDGYGESHLFCGYHWGGRLPKEPFTIMWSGCTGPSSMFVPQTATSVGFGRTMSEAIKNARLGKSEAMKADEEHKKNWKEPTVIWGHHIETSPRRP